MPDGLSCNGFSQLEAFVVCIKYKPPPSYKPSLQSPLLSLSGNLQDHEAEMKFIAPFVACGDLSAWDTFDSDATYPAPSKDERKEVVQQPTNPPYKEYMERKRLAESSGSCLWWLTLNQSCLIALFPHLRLMQKHSGSPASVL